MAAANDRKFLHFGIVTDTKLEEVLEKYNQDLLNIYLTGKMTRDVKKRLKERIAKIPKMCMYCSRTRFRKKEEKLCFPCGKQIELLEIKNRLIQLRDSLNDEKK